MDEVDKYIQFINKLWLRGLMKFGIAYKLLVVRFSDQVIMSLLICLMNFRQEQSRIVTDMVSHEKFNIHHKESK